MEHGSQLMQALFGGMTAATETSALEKRFELDLRRLSADAAVSPRALRELADVLGVTPYSLEYGTANECALLCDKAVVVATESQLVITCDGEVPIHQAFETIRGMIEKMSFEVEWSSFLRKNTSCPWDTRDATVAHEYAALKRTFPSGNPFVFGPVDSDHYFYFVYDSIRRDTNVQESDVQLNVKFYNVEDMESFEVSDKVPTKVRFLAPQVFETIRFQRNSQGNAVSLEANGLLIPSLAAVQAKIQQARPERFTIMVLLDPQSEEAALVRERKMIGFEPEHFEGYSLLNRTTNTFEHGYLVIKLSYSCQ